MKILVLGGTRLVGRYMAEAAVTAGHDVTLFHRNPTTALPEAKHAFGDRNESFDAVSGQAWDAVIDACAYYPRQIDSAAAAFGEVGRYLFVSTISVYDSPYVPPMAENAVQKICSDPTVEQYTAETYGGLKALCEVHAERAFGDRLFTIRPGLVMGPNDYTDRFTYWVAQMAHGGRFVAPARLDGALQVVDARDQGAFAIRGLEAGLSGAYNSVGPAEAVTWRDVFEIGKGVFGNFEPVQVPGPPNEKLPLNFEPEDDGLMRVDASKARAAGLVNRPLADSMRDIADWLAAQDGYELKVGLTAAEQAAILAD